MSVGDWSWSFLKEHCSINHGSCPEWDEYKFLLEQEGAGYAYSYEKDAVLVLEYSVDNEVERIKAFKEAANKAARFVLVAEFERTGKSSADFLFLPTELRQAVRDMQERSVFLLRKEYSPMEDGFKAVVALDTKVSGDSHFHVEYYLPKDAYGTERQTEAEVCALRVLGRQIAVSAFCTNSVERGRYRDLPAELYPYVVDAAKQNIQHLSSQVISWKSVKRKLT